MRLALAPLLFLSVACDASVSPPPPARLDGATVRSRGPTGAEAPAWADATLSPRPSALAAPVCAEHDRALDLVARRVVERRASGQGRPDPEDIVRWLRRSGEPHPRPRIAHLGGRAPIEPETLLRTIEPMQTPRSRCGFARARAGDGAEVATLIVVDALADLAPLPTRGRTGQWLTFEARIRVPANDVRLVVLGPRGIPRSVTTSFDRGSGAVRARFALDRPGAFTAQLVGDLPDGGPRPLLEAQVFADVEPSDELLVPGEDATSRGDLAALVDGARRAEALAPLDRDARLDAIALAHAERMLAAGEIAHDLGEGDLRDRFAAAELDARLVGENVARGRSVLAVHRALWGSPSHRLNLLSPEFTHLGIGVSRGDDGTVYACEVFARDPR